MLDCEEKLSSWIKEMFSSQDSSNLICMQNNFSNQKKRTENSYIVYIALDWKLKTEFTQKDSCWRRMYFVSKIIFKKEKNLMQWHSK